MTCEHVAEAIADLQVDREVERHLESCARCRTLLHDLRQIREAASQLDRLAPSPQVWARISEQLASTAIHRAKALRRRNAAPVLWRTPSGVPDSAAWQAMIAHRLWRTPAALAAALVLVVAGAVWFALRPAPAPAPGRLASSGPSAGSAAEGGTDLVQSVEMELQRAEQHYEKAIAGLEQIVQTAQILGGGGSALDAQTAATLQKNLAVIDQAIGESRAALRSQPSSPPAQESLFEAFRTKVGLLQEAVVLVNEMRKGNQAETARIVGDLNR